MADLTLKYLLFGEDKTASKAIKGVADTAEESSKRFSGASKAWQAGAALAGAAFVKAGIDIVMSASDQNEVISKTGVVFGKNAAAIESWASSADTSLGLSKTAALTAASSFGDMFLQLGVGADQALGMSKQVVQLAADLGSFSNLPTDQVLDDIAGAMRGEYDAIQKVIPGLSDARVKQEALTMTGKKSVDQLTAQEKAQATLAIITKDGSRAQGDFARTSDGLANSLKIAQAAAANEAADLGQKLLPAVTAVVRGFTAGVGAVGGFVDSVSSIPTPVLASVAALTSFHLLRGPLSDFGSRVGAALRPAGESVRLFGLYAREAGGGVTGLKAGLSALSGGLGTGQVAMSGLKSVGGALFGLMGGPWGAAITGATVLIGAWAQAQANSRADVQSLTDTLDQQSGKFTELSRKFVAENFSFNVSPDDLASLEQLGFKLSDITTAALGTNDQYQAMRDRLREVAEGNQGANAAASGTLTALDNMRGAAQQATTQWQVYGRLAGDAADKTQSVDDKAAAAVRSLDILSISTKLSADAAQAAADQQKELADALDDVTNAAVDADKAQIDYEAAVDDASAALKENGRTLDVNTAKGRANKQALIDQADKARDAAKAQLTNGASVDSVSGAMDRARAKFVDQAIKMGASRKAAEEMATKYGLTRGKVDELNTAIGKTPKQKVTDVKANTAAALAAIAGVKAALAGLRDRSVVVNTYYKTHGTPQPGAGNLAKGVATGGPVRKGVPYLVGENRDGSLNATSELFVPDSAGTILNAAQTQAYFGSSGRAVGAGGGGGGETFFGVVQFVMDGRVVHEQLLKLKRQTGGSLGLA